MTRGKRQFWRKKPKPVIPRRAAWDAEPSPCRVPAAPRPGGLHSKDAGQPWLVSEFLRFHHLKNSLLFGFCAFFLLLGSLFNSSDENAALYFGGGCLFAALYVNQKRGPKIGWQVRDQDLVLRTRFRTQRIDWKRIEHMEMQPRQITLQARNEAGEKLVVTFGDHKTDPALICELRDALLERCDALGLLAWGTGLLVHRPFAHPPAARECPDRIVWRDGFLWVEGPHNQQLCFTDNDGQCSLVAHHLGQRLAPLCSRNR